MDLESSWPDLLAAAQLPASSYSLPGQERVQLGLLSPDGGFGYETSPVDEVLVDSIWSQPPTEGGGSYSLPGLQPAAARKFTSSSCYEDLVQLQQLTSDTAEVIDSSYLDYESSNSYSSIDDGSLPLIDETFEFGDVSDVGIGQLSRFQDEVTLPLALDDFDAGYQKFDRRFSADAAQPIHASFSVGCLDDQFDSILQESFENVSGLLPADSIVPVQESSISPLDSLDDDQDSLHDAESVCQLLRELDGTSYCVNFLRGDSSPVLSHFSPEEVESVLSRDSSSGDLAGMETRWSETDAASTDACVESIAPYTVITSIPSPVAPPTVIKIVPSSYSTIIPTSMISAVSAYLPVSQPFLTLASPVATIASPSVSVGTLPAISTPAVVRISSSPSSASPLSQEYEQNALVTKQTPSTRSIRPNTLGYNEVLTERRERKKEQNKSAALKYRQRKREEKGHVLTEVEELEQENDRLKKRAEDLTKEINYLKGLLEEITKP